MLPLDIVTLSSPNFNSRKGTSPIGIIIHCLGMEFLECLNTLTEKKSNVSAHYFIPFHPAKILMQRYPQVLGSYKFNYPDQCPVFVFVCTEKPDENTRAWQAGKSTWANWNSLPTCAISLNSCSIGIEFQSPGYANENYLYHFSTYSIAQINTGIHLIHHLVNFYKLNPFNILGHSDIAWNRISDENNINLSAHPKQILTKTDPGALFPWKTLYAEGLGYLSPDISKISLPIFSSETEKILWVQKHLQDIGYIECPASGTYCKKTLYAIDAYKLHFLQESWKTPFEGINDTLIKSLIAFHHCYDI